MFGIVKAYNIGKVIAERVKGFQVWDRLPKKMLKKHPRSYVICPDCRVKVPKVMTKETEETYHIHGIQMVSDTYKGLEEMRDHMIKCAGDRLMIVGDKAFWLHAITKHNFQKKGSKWQTALTYIFRLRSLSLTERKNFSLTEDKNG